MSDCIPFTGAIGSNGYGRLKFRGAVTYAHRVAYIEARGPIPTGMQIDHTCHNVDLTCMGGDTCTHRRCVNPDHLEVVTPAENTRRAPRSNANKTRCPQGHEYTEANTYRALGRRYCCACRAAAKASA